MTTLRKNVANAAFWIICTLVIIGVLVAVGLKLWGLDQQRDEYRARCERAGGVLIPDRTAETFGFCTQPVLKPEKAHG